MEDEALVRETLAGSDEAFGALVERYQGSVYGYAWHYMRDYAEAQDLAQDAFVEAYRRLDQLRDPSLFSAWLRGITLNFCRRTLRDRARHRDSQALATLVDAAPSAEEALQTQELREDTLALLDALSEKNRLVTTLYYIEDLSYEEIGRFLDLPISTVKGRLHKARKQLKQEVVDMVHQDFTRHKLDARFAEEVLSRTGLTSIEVNLSDDHGVIWFSTEDDRHFAVSFPAATARTIATAPKPCWDPELRQSGVALGTSLEELSKGEKDATENAAKMDMRQFALDAFAHFDIAVSGILVDCGQGAAVTAIAVLESGEKSHSASLPFADAVLLAGRSGAPIYATNRVFEAVALDGGAGRTISSERARDHISQTTASEKSSNILYDALDQRIDQVRIQPQQDGAQVSFVKDGERREVSELDAQTFEYLRNDVLFTKSDDNGHLHARRGDQAFVLDASNQDGELVLDISAAQL